MGVKKRRGGVVFCLHIGPRSTTFALGSSAAHQANELASDAEATKGTAVVSGGGRRAFHSIGRLSRQQRTDPVRVIDAAGDKGVGAPRTGGESRLPGTSPHLDEMRSLRWKASRVRLTVLGFAIRHRRRPYKASHASARSARRVDSPYTAKATAFVRRDRIPDGIERGPLGAPFSRRPDLFPDRGRHRQAT